MLKLSLIHLPMLFLVILVVSGSVIPSAFTAETTSATPAASASAPASSTVSAGTIEDTLSACLARIPKDATPGQRMIAEQSCHRDEGERQPAHTFSGR